MIGWCAIARWCCVELSSICHAGAHVSDVSPIESAQGAIFGRFCGRKKVLAVRNPPQRGNPLRGANDPLGKPRQRANGQILEFKRALRKARVLQRVRNRSRRRSL
jgi:hypothetical protein